MNGYNGLGMLSSDILERQFGPTRVEILHQNAAGRLIQTVACDSGQVLELSWVVFRPAGVREFAAIHQTVVAGQSMGKAFREAGVRFSRRTRMVTRRALPAGFSRRFACSGPGTVIEVDIEAGDRLVRYARILEVYSPAVRWPETAAKS